MNRRKRDSLTSGVTPGLGLNEVVKVEPTEPNFSSCSVLQGKDSP